jgi:hypothetical protein
MFRTRSLASRTVSWVLLTALTSPSAFAQAPAAKPSTPAKPPAAAPSAPAAAPSTKAASPAASTAVSPAPARADLPPFTKPLAETLTGAAKSEYEAGRLLYADGDYAGAALKFQRA